MCSGATLSKYMFSSLNDVSSVIHSVFGIRLKGVSSANGQSRRTATSPQSRTATHFGALRKSRRRSKTTSTRTLAEMLIFRIV